MIQVNSHFAIRTLNFYQNSKLPIDNATYIWYNVVKISKGESEMTSREQVEKLRNYMTRKHRRRNFTGEEVITAARRKGMDIDRRNIRGWASNWPEILGIAMVRDLDDVWWR